MSDSYAISQNDNTSCILHNQSPEIILTYVKSSMLFFKSTGINANKNNQNRIYELNNRLKKHNRVLSYYKAWINKANNKYEEYRVQLTKVIENLKLLGNKYKQIEVEKKLIDASFALMTKIKFAESRIRDINDNKEKYLSEINQLKELNKK